MNSFFQKSVFTFFNKLLRYASIACCVLLFLRTINSVEARQALATSSLHKDPSDAVYLKAVCSNSIVYSGQPFTVSYFLYHRIPLIAPDDALQVTFKDCFVEEYPPAKGETQQIINGQIYHVILLKKYLLIPQWQQSIIIPSLAQQYKVKEPPVPSDFFGEEKILSRTFRSKELKVSVLPLPNSQFPTLFSNAVGQFAFHSAYTVSKKRANFLTYHLTITGCGSLKNIRIIHPLMPSGADIFNEYTKEKHHLTAQGLASETTYSFDVVANYQSTYRIPGVSILYFNPDSGRFVSFTSPALTWEVKTGAPLKNKELRDNKMLAKSIENFYIKNKLNSNYDQLLLSKKNLLYTIVICTSLTCMLMQLYLRHLKLEIINISYFQFKNAKKIALKSINKLQKNQLIKSVDFFHKELFNILQTYLCYKLISNPQDLTTAKLVMRLELCLVPKVHQIKTVHYLEAINKLRFSSSNSLVNTNASLKELIALITSLDICFANDTYTKLSGASQYHK